MGRNKHAGDHDEFMRRKYEKEARKRERQESMHIDPDEDPPEKEIPWEEMCAQKGLPMLFVLRLLVPVCGLCAR